MNGRSNRSLSAAPVPDGVAEADFCGMVGQSPAMRYVYQRIEQFARLPIPVLILGESGTGKELAARAIWQISAPERPFVVVGCAAIATTLIESELFGHERGAFTGAVRRHTGLLAQADGGILFLDEIAELSLHAQAKLLRAIETQEYRPVGGEVIHKSRFRVIAATHRDLDALAADGRFREDLLHRLGAARIVIPPLRHRLEDVPRVAECFLQSFRRASGRDGPIRLSEPAVDLLCEAQWPGNVRQLRNVVEAAAAVASSPPIEADDIAEFLRRRTEHYDCRAYSSEHHSLTLREVVRRAQADAVREALRLAGGDRSAAAATLGISRATLFRKLALLDGSGGNALDSQS